MWRRRISNQRHVEKHQESNKHKNTEKIITSKQRITNHPNFIIKNDEEGIQKLPVFFSSTNISFTKIHAYYSSKILIIYISNFKKHHLLQHGENC